MDLYKLLSGSPCIAIRSFWTTDWSATYECDPARVVVDALGGDKNHAAPPQRTGGAMSAPATQTTHDPVTGEASAMKAHTASKRRQPFEEKGARLAEGGKAEG
eukprot:CAMPEP_0118936332 /NCGR_PEP_ID=MMETSP1169-20130426/18083_1 /TAXON_ID=36882 /ORGANISM="Pyramimonas obovata, Strain CCMP722" /LENGTH=102 /DNA_ID=CAMNT_0006879533 /DNA_START=297 /DNA_END=602 /DNA_ORIENTATION=+